MIRDGIVTYEVRPTTFQNVRFDSELLNAAVLAVLTTVLSYQLIAIFYNIFFGSKARGRATASDIHKIILMEIASPLAAFAAIARVDFLERLRFKGELPRNMRIARRDTRTQPKVTLSVIFLLLIAPLCNLISIFIVLERDEALTFNESGFGGLALGVQGLSLNFSFSGDPSCGQIPLRIVGDAKSIVEFQLCSDVELALNQSVVANSNQVRIVAEETPLGQIEVSVINLPASIPDSTAVHVDLMSDGKLFRIQPVLGLQDAARLIHDGQDKLAEFCDAAKTQNSPQEERLLQIEDRQGLMKASKDFNCSIDEVQQYIDIMLNMSVRINVVERNDIKVMGTDKLDLIADSPTQYFDAGQFRFIIQRGRNIHLLVLVAAVAGTTLLRIATSISFNNDLEEALQVVVRYRLGLDSHESMLKSKRTVQYDSKGQSSLTAHYGLQEWSLQEVKRLDAGIEISTEEQSSTELREAQTNGRM